MKEKIINCSVKALDLTYDEWLEIIKTQLDVFGKVKFENFDIALKFVSERIYNYMEDEDIAFVLIKNYKNKRNVKINYNLEEIKAFVEIEVKKISDEERGDINTVKLHEEIDDIIKSFYNKNGNVKKEILESYLLSGEAINWGNLKCIDVKRKYVAYISEASSNCSLKEYLKQEMKKKGYDIEVITEW